MKKYNVCESYNSKNYFIKEYTQAVITLYTYL